MSEYPFLFAKVRGKLARMVEVAAYEELLKSADLPSVLDRLRGTPYGPHLETTEHLDDRLLQGFLTEVADLLLVLSEEDKLLVLDVVAKYRLENLKALIRAHLHRLSPEEVKEHLLLLPWEEVDYEGWLRLPGLEALIQALPWREERRRLAAIYQQVGETENPFPYEAALDALYLERLLEHRTRRSPWVKEILGNRVLKELLLWGHRLRGYGRSFPEMVNIFPDFRSLIRLEELRGILELEEEEGWRRLGRWLSGPLAAELERAERFDPDLIERSFDQQLISLIKRLLLLATMDIAVVIGYLYWKELELQGLIGLVERARLL